MGGAGKSASLGLIVIVCIGSPVSMLSAWAGNQAASDDLSQAAVEQEAPSGKPDAADGDEPEQTQAQSIIVEARKEIRALAEAGKYAPAEEKAHQLLSRIEALSGKHSIDTADALDLVTHTMVLNWKGTHPEALEYAKRSLAIREEAYGPTALKVTKSLTRLAAVLNQTDDPKTAKALLERVLAIKEEHLGPEHQEVATALTNLGLMLSQLDDYDAAKARHEEALAIMEKLLGPEGPEVAAVLNNLARVLEVLEEYERSISLQERALAIRQEALGPDHPEIADILVDLAWVLQAIAEYDKARLHLERALELREKAFGNDHPEIASTLSRLGGVLLDTGQHDEALELHRRALAMRERLLGPEHVDVAVSLQDLGEVLREQSQHADAKLAFERALAIFEKRLGPEHTQAGVSVNSLAVVAWETGDYPGAQELYERALVIFEKAYGPNHVMCSVILQNLALVYWQSGDYAEARSRFERALSVAEKALGREHPDIAATMRNSGILLVDMGDYREARALYERALAMNRNIFGEEHPSVAGDLTCLADLLIKIGKHEEARPMAQRALEIYQKKLGPEHFRVAYALSTLAEIDTESGSFDAADALWRKSIKIWEKTAKGMHAGLSLDLYYLAEVRIALGDLEEAQALHERALAMRRGLFGEDHPRVAASLSGLAKLAWLRDEPREAFTKAIAAGSIARRHFQDTARALSEREALRFEDIRTTGFDVALSVLARSEPGRLPPDARRQVWDEMVLSRAMVLDEMASRQRSLAEEGAGAAELQTRLKTARNRLAQLVIRDSGSDEEESIENEVREARSVKERIERELAQKSSAYRSSLERSKIGYAEVRRSLPSGSALVAYVRYAQLNRATGHTAGSATGIATGITTGNATDMPGDTKSVMKETPSYAALLQTSRVDEPVIVPLGSAGPIEMQVEAWRQKVSEPQKGVGLLGGGKEAKYQEVAKKLRQLIWDPIAVHLTDVKQVFVVPDGALHLVSLASLPVGDNEYLAEKSQRIHYLSAERDLVREELARSRGRGLLALGSPDFDAKPVELAAMAVPSPGEDDGLASSRPSHAVRKATCAEFKSMRFGSLAASRLEVDEIESLWAGKTSPEAEREREVLKLTGAQAGESQFKSLAEGRLILHVATHGFFALDRCSSSLNLTQEVSRSAFDTDSPLLLTGLALAGANRRDDASDQMEDGILTAEEIATLDLSGVEWAVLSACETGLGKVQAGEGVLGLRRAFELSGAGTVIMSLWAVEDEATREWMRELYTARLGGLETAEAMRQASLAVIERRREAGRSAHPFYWGAFVAAGDWR